MRTIPPRESAIYFHLMKITCPTRRWFSISRGMNIIHKYYKGLANKIKLLQVRLTWRIRVSTRASLRTTNHLMNRERSNTWVKANGLLERCKGSLASKAHWRPRIGHSWGSLRRMKWRRENLIMRMEPSIREALRMGKEVKIHYIIVRRIGELLLSEQSVELCWGI